MSHASFAAAFEPAENWYREQVIYATWGHLAPVKNRTYKGHVVWALGCLGNDNLNPTILQFDFGPDLTSSPWLYDLLTDFLQSISKEEGAVFRWDGSMRNYKFNGIVNRIYYEGMAPRTMDKQAVTLTKKNFDAIAAEIRAFKTCIQRQKKAREVIPELLKSNPRFDKKRFLIACNA